MQNKGRTFPIADFTSKDDIRSALKLRFSVECQNCGGELNKWRQRVGYGLNCLFSIIQDELKHLLRDEYIKCYGPYGGERVPWRMEYLQAAFKKFRGTALKEWFKNADKKYSGLMYPSCDIWTQDGRILKSVIPNADAAYMIRLCPVPWHCMTCWYGVAKREKDGDLMWERKKLGVEFLMNLWEIGREIQGDNEPISVIFGHLLSTGRELAKEEEEHIEIWRHKLIRAVGDPYH